MICACEHSGEERAMAAPRDPSPIGEHDWHSDDYVEAMLTAAPMHDVGKLGTPDHILLKKGRLEGAELVEMQRHAEIGKDFRILGISYQAPQ